MTARLTQTQARIYRLLSDLEPHARRELYACLPDPGYATPHALQAHVHNLRRKLPAGESIHHCTTNGPAYYLLVRRPASPR